MQGGPLRKPDRLRQRRNKPRTMAVAPRDGSVRLVHKPPSGLCSDVAQGWLDFWDDELSSLVGRLDLPALRRLFVLYDEWERTFVALRAKPPARPKRRAGEDHNDFQRRVAQWNLAVSETGRLVHSPKGGMALNPLLRYLEELEREIVALEDRFSLTPAARQKMGLAELRAQMLAEHNAQFRIEESDGDDDPTAALLQSQNPVGP